MQLAAGSGGGEGVHYEVLLRTVKDFPFKISSKGLYFKAADWDSKTYQLEDIVLI